MSYEDALASAWADGPAAALEFLRGIFHALENQKIQGKPTDYLSDRDDEYVSPAFGFDRMQKLFATRWMAPDELLEFIESCLLESRTVASDQKHRVQPFNAFVLVVSTYGHGDANLRSVHVQEDGESWKAQYGLYHQLIEEGDNYDPETEDDEDTYAFIYALEDGERYRLMHEDEALDGAELFRHVRQAQYGVFASEFVGHLFAREAMAEFPKQLPFRLYVAGESMYGDEGTTEDWFAVGEVLTQQTLADHPLRDAHLKSAEPPPELTRDERWIYLLGYVSEPDSAEFRQLVALLDEHDDLRSTTHELAIVWRDCEEPAERLEPAWHAVPRQVSALSFARLWWALGAETRDHAVSYVRHVLERPLPSLEGLRLDEALREGQRALTLLHAHWEEVPGDARAALQDAWTAASAAAVAHPHPGMRVMNFEEALRAEHGEDVVELDEWGPATYQLEHITDEYVEALGAVLDAMPEEFPGYGGSWDFVMNRLEGLGERASSLTPKVVQLLNRYCEDSRRNSNEVQRFATVLFGMGLESPPALIHAYCERDQYHMIECYNEWSERLPKQNWARFREAFTVDADQFSAASGWTALLVDNKKGFDLFCQQISEAEDIDAILERLCLVAPDDELIQRFVGALAAKLDGGGRHKPKDEQATVRVVQLLEVLPHRAEDEEQMLRRARLLLARFAIDAGKSPDIGSLLASYPGHPMLLFFQTELLARGEGAAAAGRAATNAVRTLAANDLVYRKAFFRYTGTVEQTWEAADAVHGYTAYRWAYDHYRADGYRDGEFCDGQRTMDHDPFYRGFERCAAKLSEDELADARREAALELEFGQQMQTLSDAELAEHMTKQSWNITSQICRRLAPAHAAFGPRLLAAYDWFREDETRRMALLTVFWPERDFRPALLAHAALQKDLAWLIRRYPGITASDMAREVFSRLAEADEHALILETVHDLPAATVQAVFKSVDVAISKLGAYDEGIAILEKMREETSEKKPEFVLLTTNLGVLQYRKGDVAAAEDTFDTLFDMDWSRFDYDPSARDPMMASLFGSDLNAQVADVFRQYFASAKFNAACVYANRDRLADAVDALREAAALDDGYDADKFAGDEDLAALRESAEYREMLAGLGGGQ